LVGGDPEQRQWLLESCLAINSVAALVLGLRVYSAIVGAEDSCVRLAVSALDAGHLVDRNSPIYKLILELFGTKEPIDRWDHYQIVSKPSNALRLEIYRRASQLDAPARICRQLLAALEGLRIEYGRPLDEARHPDPRTGTAWTDVLALN